MTRKLYRLQEIFPKQIIWSQNLFITRFEYQLANNCISVVFSGKKIFFPAKYTTNLPTNRLALFCK
jgi:hypothetical protein